MFAGLTNEAAHIIDSTVNITPMQTISSCEHQQFLITILGTY